MSETAESRFPSWAIPVGLAVLVVVLGAIALVRGSGNPDPTTPEGALQLYLLGIADGDFEQAYRFLDPEDFQGCEPEDLGSGGFFEDFTALHNETRLRDGAATIIMDLRFGQGGLFGGWTERVSFDMVERDGFWYVAGEPWPHFRFNC